MWPKIGPIYTYGTLYLLGIVLHFILSWRIAKRAGLPRRTWITVSLCYLVGMTLGAKLLFDLRSGQVSLGVLFQLQHWMGGGLWGGLLAYCALAVPAVILFFRPRAATLDLVATTIPIPWIAAKLGCLCNGCCHGRPCSLPWALAFPEGARTAPAGIPVHPTQLYEVALMLVILVVFARLRSDWWRGTKLLWFLTLYGLGRAALDFLRGDNEHYLVPGVLTVTQLICLIVSIAALFVLASWFDSSSRRVGPNNGNRQGEQEHV
jgi:phosphatidylglycerol:prolipoprotein diacylglycerol transferase